MTAAQESPGTELDKLWSLLAELSSQLSHNRQQTEELHRRAEELKTQAVHTQTGFTLRRFNTDVSLEEFESELERLNVSLVQENQALQGENRQLSGLLKDYEGTLEAVMAKFRAHAQSTQQYHLDLIRHYENILLSFPSQPIGQNQPLPSAAEPAEPSIDPLHLSLSLSHLASLIRKALRSLQGEDPEDGSSPLLFPTPTDNDDLASLASQLSSLNFPHSAYSSASASGSTRSYSTNSSTLDSPPLPPSTPRHTRDESEGGYIGKSATTSPHHLPTTSSSSLVPSPPKPGETLLPDLLPRKIVRDDALEAEIELEALRTENEELRRMLGISKSQEEVGGAESYGAAVDDIN